MPATAAHYLAAAMRVLGRLDDLRRSGRPRHGHSFCDQGQAWTPAKNAAWLADGVRLAEPFLQLSPAAAGTVLAAELAALAGAGYAAIGPLWLPRRWTCDAVSYRRGIRLCVEHVSTMPRGPVAGYVDKALAELEPMLAMWPHVLLAPTTAPLSRDDMVLSRALPVHALGLVDAPAWADGRWCSPAEFFCHDLDHARFKVREDLLCRGRFVPDPYVAGDTFEAATGRHRVVMAAALPKVDGALWRAAPRRRTLLRAWWSALAALPQPFAEAVRWLLFELLHEKSLPVEPRVLRHELSTAVHVDKFRRKVAAGFYAAVTPPAAVMAHLDAARAWLVGRCGGRS